MIIFRYDFKEIESSGFVGYLALSAVMFWTLKLLFLAEKNNIFSRASQCSHQTIWVRVKAPIFPPQEQVMYTHFCPSLISEFEIQFILLRGYCSCTLGKTQLSVERERKIETYDYKTVWQLKCKWIRNMWIKFPLKHTWFF